MMNLSTRFLALFGLLPITVFAVSCAQPGGGAPAAPSALSGGPSATAVGPSAGYDATGRWLVANTDAQGNVEETFERDITQDSNGNLHLLDEDGQPVTLERLSEGEGAIITYRLSFIGSEGGNCDIRVQGTVLLDTRTNTFTGHLRLKELGCENGRQGAGVIGTKLS
jgi:hypothetical protein